MSNSPNYIVIVGPTASGKTQLAIDLVEKLKIQRRKAEIISCDTVQVYRKFDIGSAKPTQEQQSQVKHHCIDLCDWHESFDAADYAKTAKNVVSDLKAQNILPVFVGGAGLYLRAFWGDRWSTDLPSSKSLREELQNLTNEELYSRLKNQDSLRASELHINDRVRLLRALEIIELTGQTFAEIKAGQQSQKQIDRGFVIYLKPERDKLRKYIKLRCQQMLDQGLVEEVEGLLHSGVLSDCKPMQSIGYLQTYEFLKHKYNAEEYFNQFFTQTCQYAKRQMTWFNKVPTNMILRDNQSNNNLMEDLIAATSA